MSSPNKYLFGFFVVVLAVSTKVLVDNSFKDIIAFLSKLDDYSRFAIVGLIVSVIALSELINSSAFADKVSEKSLLLTPASSDSEVHFELPSNIPENDHDLFLLTFDK